MQRLVTILRIFLVASLILAVVGSSIDGMLPPLMPEEIWDVLSLHYSSNYEAYILPALVLAALLVVLLVATVGMFLLRRWARPLLLWTTVVSMLVVPFTPPTAYSGVSQAIIAASMMLGGAVLAMAYFSDLRTHFERKPPTSS